VAFRVLSLDGGGVRGILPARVLVELESITGRPTSELFDLVAGTATGGVLALGLAAPGPGGSPRFQASELLALYLERGADLFPAPDPIHRVRRLLGGSRPHSRAVATLSERFGDTPLGDALVELIIPTFDLGAGAPLLLRSKEFHAGLGPRMTEVALATSSIPSHFPPVSIELGSRTWKLTHGGLIANNPSPFAYAAALARADPNEVVLVSLGTGTRAQEVRSRYPLRHSARWPLASARSFELQLESSSEAQHQMVDALLAATGHGERYWRIQSNLLHRRAANEHNGLGGAELESIADEQVFASRPQLEEIAKALAA
jgi:patatin-like phospholipase/acyl hydrolase